MSENKQLPFQREPYDALRQGLPSHKNDTQKSHPIEAAQIDAKTKQAREEHRRMLCSTYGAALVAQLDIEREILTNVQRFPDIPPSMLGWEILSGSIEDIDVVDYLGTPQDNERSNVNVHQVYEQTIALNNLDQVGKDEIA